jgi:VWFA-related protein
MKYQGWLCAAVVLIAAGGCNSWAQQAEPQTASGAGSTITTETRLVLVDTVVTDKKGNYVRDLTQKDFKVFEDGKEQPIKSFSSETDASSPTVNQKHYMVLFFDDSTMNVSDQGFARKAALQFLESNTGADRYIAVVDFNGTLRVSQNFTTDAARLKQAAQNVKFSAVSPIPETNAGGILQLPDTAANFGAHTLLLALRDMAKSLSGVPGRKSVVLLSDGFPYNPGDAVMQAEVTAAIAACNKANVAIYAIDVRGVGTITEAPPLKIWPDSEPGRLVSATLHLSDDEDSQSGNQATIVYGDDAPARLVYVQRGGTGGGGGGRPGGGGTTGGGARNTGGSTSTVRMPTTTTSAITGNITPYSQASTILPTIANGSQNQQILYLLAEGTGGFVIVNSNDLLGGIQKIAQEQNQYYLLGYTPPPSDEGACHTLKVKVDRGDTIVRSRSGYCNVRPSDLLAGKPIEKQLENQVTGSQPGNVAATMQAPYFYTAPNVARVELAIDIPASAIKFDKDKGKQHAQVNVLGIAYRADGSVGGRFSDTAEFNFDSKDQVEAFNKQPYHYENEFEIGPGDYKLKVAFNSGGSNFGKLEMPLVVDSYDAKQLSISTVALSTDIRPVNQAGASLDAALLEDRKPLVSQGMQIVPTGADRFKIAQPAVLYFEIYEPLLSSANPPKVGIQLQVVDRKTGEKKVDMGGLIPTPEGGNPVVPFGMRMPLDKLTPGSYQLEVKAIDTAGNSTSIRKADFEVE